MLKKNIFYLSFIESIPIFFTVFAVCIAYLNISFMGFFYNSDILGIADIFKDLSNGGHFRDWVIPTTGMFFPDWIIFWVAFISTKNIYYQLLIMACINTSLMYLMVRIIYGQFFGRKKAILYSCASIGMMLLFIFKNLLPFILLLVPTQHVGGFIIGLLYLYLNINLLDKKSNKNKIGFILAICIICFLMGVSDVLFAVQFLIPTFLVYVFLHYKKKINFNSILVFSGIPILFFISGLCVLRYWPVKNFFWQIVKYNLEKHSLFESYKHNIFFIINNLKAIIHDSFSVPVYLLYIIFFCFIIAIFCTILLNNKNKLKDMCITNSNEFVSTFLLFSTIVTICTIVFFTNGPPLRYIEPLFFFPVLFLFFIDSFFYKKYISSIFYVFACIILFILLAQLVILYKKTIILKKNFYPVELACIDQALVGEGKNGISDYWTARPISLFSHLGLNIFSFNADLTPFEFATKINRSQSFYSYAIIDILNDPVCKLDQEFIENINGLPKKIVNCGSKKLLIYPKNSFIVRKKPVFSHHGDSYNWSAASLPSLIPNSKKGKLRIAKSGDIQSFISFGPYVLLSEGHYHFSIKYKSDARSTCQAAFYDIFSKESGVTSKKFIYGTHGKPGEITGKFEVNKSQENKNLFEIRVFTLGLKDFVLKDITLVKD